MTVLAVFAYGFIAFGPVGALFAVNVARNPHEVIIMMVGYVHTGKTISVPFLGFTKPQF